MNLHLRCLDVRRRTVLRGGLIGGTLAMAACSSEGPGASTSEPPGDTTAPTSGQAPSASGQSPSQPLDDRPRVLVVFYSRAGENYYYGDRIDPEVGNTEVVAGFISSRLDELGVDHDVHRLQAADPYPDDYDATVGRNSREQDDDARPAIGNPLESIEDYDVVLVGSPIWNVRPPMLMHTFAEAHDFAGRTIHPFVTYAVSGLGTAEDEYASACPGAEVGTGLAVRGETVRKDGPSAVAEWLDAMDLPA